MNPNAPSFGFNPAADGFVPRFLQQQQQQQQQQWLLQQEAVGSILPSSV